MRKALNTTILMVVVLLGMYTSGSRYPIPIFDTSLPSLKESGSQLEILVNTHEEQYNLKSNNEARIIWADSNKQKTKHAILYLHGYGASQEEGAPTHRNIAQKFGVNLYLSRLEGHGVVSDSSFKSLTPENYMASAKRALAIAQQLGDSVIIMSTSTGGSFGLYLSSICPKVSGLIMYSPYVDLHNKVLNQIIGPWGETFVKNIPKQVVSFDRGELQSKYWSQHYHVNGYLTLISSIKGMMTASTFKSVNCPVFMGYYYKNDLEQDPIVSVTAMLKMFDQLGTPIDKKVKKAFPETGDHVIASYIKSKDIASVGRSTEAFIISITGLQPNDSSTTIE